MTWRRALADGIYRCGSCGKAIAAGELVATTRTGAERCEACARKIEDPPANVPAETTAADVTVPAGIRHQPSFGFGGGRNHMVSTGEIARQHVARHFEKRTS